MGTKKSQRSVLGARLVARLTGPARLLAMSWSLEELSGTHGARNLLSKLEQSPLVRKQLPNTAAVLQQYFNYRRQGHENINAYLARESLYYLEALMALHGGHRGHAGLLDPEASSSSSESEGGDKDKKGYKAVPTEDPSSSALKGGSQGSRPDGSRPGSARAGETPGLSITDSFILIQLRGWRLLSGAALSSEEWKRRMEVHFWPQPRTSWTTTAFGKPSRFCSMSKLPTHGTPHFFNMAEEDTGEMKIGGMMEHPGRLLPGKRVPNGPLQMSLGLTQGFTSLGSFLIFA